MITTGGSPPDPAPRAEGQEYAAGAHGASATGGATDTAVAEGTGRDPEAGGAAPLRAPLKADWVPWLIALAAFAAYTTISLSRYFRLDPGSWDLGIFTEYVRQLAHLRAPVVNIHGAGFNLLGDHFQPIVGLIAPLFLLFPSAATLLVVQALLTAVSVIPVSRAADRRRVRVFLGPPADDRLRLPRDRVRGPAGGLLPLGAVAGQAPRRGG